MPPRRTSGPTECPQDGIKKRFISAGTVSRASVAKEKEEGALPATRCAVYQRSETSTNTTHQKYSPVLHPPMQLLTIWTETPPHGVETGFSSSNYRKWKRDDLVEVSNIRSFPCAFGCGVKVPLNAKPRAYSNHISEAHGIHVTQAICPLPYCVGGSDRHTNLMIHLLRDHHSKYYQCPFFATSGCRRWIMGNKQAMVSHLNHVHPLERRRRLTIEVTFWPVHEEEEIY